jgi:uncharacterized YigZ family protein
MDVLLEGAAAAIEVKRSKFIGEAFPLTETQSPRDILRRQKERYRDASHVVHAFIAGDAGEIRGMSDDGEPGGTAARPIMDILAGTRCTNILLTVTRYFGGTLLGTGGLVRAYGDAARAVLALCKTGPLPPPCRQLICAVPYGQYESLTRALTALGSTGIRPDWAAAAAVGSAGIPTDPLSAAIPLTAWPEALDVLHSYGVKC